MVSSFVFAWSWTRLVWRSDLPTVLRVTLAPVAFVLGLAAMLAAAALLMVCTMITAGAVFLVILWVADVVG